MKTIFSATLLAAGLVLTSVGIAAADTPSVATDPAVVVAHHSTAHGIGQPRPMKAQAG